MYKPIQLLVLWLAISEAIPDLPKEFSVFLTPRNDRPLLNQLPGAVLIFGDDGSGKSTVTSFLTDTTLESVKECDGCENYIIKESNGRKNTIAPEAGSFVPKMFVDHVSGVAYYDCPGFQSSRSPADDLLAGYHVDELLTNLESFKVVLVADYSTIQRSNFSDLIGNVAKLLKNVENYKDGIAMIVNKVYKPEAGNLMQMDDKRVIEQIAEFLEDEKECINDYVSNGKMEYYERESYEQRIKLLDILLTKRKFSADKYVKIGIIRKVEHAGPLKSMDSIQREINIIRKILQELAYISNNRNVEFGHMISSLLDKYVRELKTYTLNKLLSDDFMNICQEVKDNYRSEMEVAESVETLNDTYVQTLSAMKDISFLDTLTFVQDFLRVTKNRATKSTVNKFQNNIKFLKFLFKVNVETVSVPKIYKENIENVKQYIQWTYELLLEDLAVQVLNVEFPSFVAKVINDIRIYFQGLEDRSTDIFILHERLSLSYEELSKVNFLNPHRFVQAINKLNLSVSMENLYRVFDMMKRINSEFQFHVKSLETPALMQKELGMLTAKLKDSVTWYEFLVDIYGDLTTRRSGISVNESEIIRNVIDDCRSAYIVEQAGLYRLSQVTMKEYDFLTTLNNNYFLDSYKKALINLLTIIVKAPSIHCSEDSLNMTVTGNFIRMSQVTADKMCWQEAQFVEIFALDSFIVDCDVKKVGSITQMAILSPVWIVSGKHRIVLKGSTGKTQQDADIVEGSTVSNLKGANGTAGIPGGPGGNFLGIGKMFIKSVDLSIISEGGDGGPGQNGGKGAKGIHNPEWVNYPFLKEDIHNCFRTFKRTGKCVRNLCTRYECLYKDKLPSFIERSFSGTNGGDGGNGGVGGPEGLPGIIHNIELDEPSYISEVTIEGKKGADGKGGSGGAETTKAIILKTIVNANTYLNVKFLPFKDECLKNEFYLDGSNGVTKNGKNGTNGSSYEKYADPMKLKSLHHPANTINKYKKFIIDNLKNDVRESKLVQFMTQIEENRSVKKMDNIYSFLEEIKTLLEQYDSLQTQAFSTPFIQSALSRLRAYTVRTTLTSIENEIVNYLYAALTSTLFNLNKQANRRIIEDFDSYFNITKDEINSMRYKSSIEIINKFKNEYEKSYVDRRDFTAVIVDGEILPDIDRIFQHIEYDLMTLFNTTIVNRTRADTLQVDNLVIDDRLRNTLKKHIQLAPLKMIRSVLSFFRPTGVTSKAMLHGASCLYETSAIQSIKAATERHNLLLLFNRTNDELNSQLNNELAFLQIQVSKIRSINDEFWNTVEYVADNATESVYEHIRNAVNRIQLNIENVQKDFHPEANFKRVIHLQVDMERLGKDVFLLNRRMHDTNSKIEKNIVELFMQAAQKIIDISDCSNMPINVFLFVKDDETKMKAACSVMSTLKKEMDNYNRQGQELFNIIVPVIRNIQKDFDYLKSLTGKTHATLSLIEMDIQRVLRNVMSFFNRETTKLSAKKDLQSYWREINEGIATLLNMYNRINSFINSKKLAKYVADLQPPESLEIDTEDTVLTDNVKKLEKMIHTNILLHRYQQAIAAAKQNHFPIFGDFLLDSTLPNRNQTIDGNSVIRTAIRRVSDLQELIHDRVFSVLYDSNTHTNAYFGGPDFPPFYVWKNGSISEVVTKLFDGGPVNLVADIENGVNKNAVKFNDVRIRVKLLSPNKERVKSLQQKLKSLKATMTIGVNNYYRCNNRIYSLPLESEVAFHTNLAKHSDVRGSRQNERHVKNKGHKAILSPFGTWRIKLSGNPDDMSEFREEPMDIELIGHGTFLEPTQSIGDICNESLDEHYHFIRIE